MVYRVQQVFAATADDWLFKGNVLYQKWVVEAAFGTRCLNFKIIQRNHGVSFSVVIFRESPFRLVYTMIVNVATDETPIKPLRCNGSCAGSGSKDSPTSFDFWNSIFL